jgi:hypothetical protein
MRVSAQGVWLAAVVGLLAWSGPVPATDDDWPAWADEEARLRQAIARVNDGELSFLEQPPGSRIHRHAARVRISYGSLEDGWVIMEQCHQGIDRVPVAQILFREGSTRAIEVLSSRNIGAAYSEDNSVQLRAVADDAEICVRAETRALYPIDNGVFELRNGPFMRRFLDGYYPLQLELSIEFPPGIELADHTPETQPGFAVALSPGLIEVDSLFEGQLRTQFRFLAR